MTEKGPDCIFDVSGDEDVVWAGGGEGAEVVNHLVCARGKKSSVLKVTHGTNDALLGDIKCEACDNLEQGLKHRDGPDPFT